MVFETIGNGIICLIDTGLLYLFTSLFSHKRNLNKLTRVLPFLMVTLIQFICTSFYLNLSSIKIPIFIVINILFCFIQFYDKWYKYLVNNFLFAILCFIIEAFTLSVINIFTTIDVSAFNDYELSLFIIALIIRLIILLMIFVIKYLIGNPIHQRQWLYFLLMPVFTITFVWLIYPHYWKTGNSDIDKLLTYVGIFLIIQNAFVFFYIISLQNSTKQYIEMKSAYDRQLQYSSTIETIQKAIRKMAHDIRHHFIYLRSALDQENIPKAKAYLNQLDDNLENIIPLNVTGHYDIDALLHAKASIAEKLNIHIRVKGTLPPDLMIPPIDLSALLGNSVDNAIESASKIDGQKEINIVFCYNASRLNYTISNPYNGQLQRKPDGYFVSQKGSGLGFEIMDEVVKKYGGALLTENDDRNFKLTIMLQTPQSEK